MNWFRVINIFMTTIATFQRANNFVRVCDHGYFSRQRTIPIISVSGISVPLVKIIFTLMSEQRIFNSVQNGKSIIFILNQVFEAKSWSSGYWNEKNSRVRGPYESHGWRRTVEATEWLRHCWHHSALVSVFFWSVALSVTLREEKCELLFASHIRF